MRVCSFLAPIVERTLRSVSTSDLPSFRRIDSKHSDDLDYAVDRERNRRGFPERATRSCCCPGDIDFWDNLCAGTYLSERCGIEILRFAIALDDITDHKSHHFDHRNQTDPGTTIRVGINNGDHSFLFFENGVARGFADAARFGTD